MTRMNCQQLKEIIDDPQDHQLNFRLENDVHAHIWACDDCQRYYRQNREFQNKLGDYSKHILENSVYARAMAEAEQRGLCHVDQPQFKPWPPAVAVGLALWMAFGIGNQFPERQQDLPQVQISLNQTQNVNFTVNAEYTMESVKFVIRMPAGVDLAGMPDEREIHWEGHLLPGDNLLSLPVIAHRDPKGELEARVTYAGKSKVYRVQLALHRRHI